MNPAWKTSIVHRHWAKKSRPVEQHLVLKCNLIVRKHLAWGVVVRESPGKGRSTQASSKFADLGHLGKKIVPAKHVTISNLVAHELGNFRTNKPRPQDLLQSNTSSLDRIKDVQELLPGVRKIFCNSGLAETLFEPCLLGAKEGLLLCQGFSAM